ncbi:hypothetical protein Thiowin_04343 [Thiorhodovibrio winogradskyi]|uniref:Uncharacterized protein n=1 Tax=Thiorhodovibrio winogradskyi TaxID=77007 RepID=A0ABZ0SF07_9GAMM|nr:hypothetical protein [Thiorhodovibrio winogradskyi]
MDRERLNERIADFLKGVHQLERAMAQPCDHILGNGGTCQAPGRNRAWPLHVELGFLAAAITADFE